jgi:transposase InsO family protein
VTFAWIEERRSQYPVAVLCRVLGVSRAGYYAWRTRPPSDTARRRDRLADAIRAVHAEPHLDTYGSPRMARELNARGVACGVNTVAKVMRAAGVRARTTRRFVRTTDSKHRLPVSDNVLARDFTASKPNEKWVMDLTYIPTLEGWLFLALVVDLFSRRIVGWAMDATMTSRLVVDALAMAVSRRGAGPGLIAHSDRGSQYASDHFQAELRRHEMVGSMSGVGQCWDNAVVESTFGRMKGELTHGQRYATRDEAKASLFEYIEVFYNRVRRHSTLEYRTPDEFERTHNPNDR